VALLCGLLWALAQFAAYPPVSWWWLALAAPLPLAWLAWTSRRPWRDAAGASIGAVPFWVWSHGWVSDISATGVVPLIAYLSLWTGVLVLVLSVSARALRGRAGALVIPTVWVGVEFWRGELVLGGYPWYLAGHPVIESLLLSKPAALGGVWLVSWVVVAVPAMAVSRRCGGGWGWGAAAGAAVLGVLAGGLVDGPENGAGDAPVRTLRVGAVQTNIPQDVRGEWTWEQRQDELRALEALTLRAAGEGAELIAWPETLFPGIALDQAGASALAEAGLGHLNEPRERVLSLQAHVGVPLLVGAVRQPGLRFEGEGRETRLRSDGTYNSVYVVQSGGVVEPGYDKLRPTPFGETIPLVGGWAWLRDVVVQIGIGASGMDFGLDRGAGPRLLRAATAHGPVRVATPICFESTMARTVRSVVRADTGAELLAVVTNDGWFGGFDAGRRVHLLLSRWRCVEHGLPLVRSANTGVSALVDRQGRVLGSLGPRQAGVLVGEVRVGGERTPYSRWIGDSVGWVCAGAGMVVLGWSWLGSWVGKFRGRLGRRVD
jgi:apolipoprotein N-acyltransferase